MGAQWTDFKQKCGPGSSGKSNVGKGFLSATAPTTEQPDSQIVAESPKESVNQSDAQSRPATNHSNSSSAEAGSTEAPPAACNHENPTVSLVMSWGTRRCHSQEAG